MNETIIQLIVTLFAAADERNWQKAMLVMNETVLLDYSSMNGNPAALFTRSEILESWAAFLPGFDRTLHQLSDFEVKENEMVAEVHFSGKAEHWIADDCWTVEGSYDIRLIWLVNEWRVTELTFQFDKQGGDMDLPALAMDRMKQSRL